MGNVSHDMRARISEEQAHRCAYCGVKFGVGLAEFTIDHVTPRSMGGGNSYANLVGACFRCNALRRTECAYSFYNREGWRQHFLCEPFLPAPSLQWGQKRGAKLGDLWPRQVAA